MEETEALTPRQFEILVLVSKGLSNKEISELLAISQNTVKVHVAAIMRLLGVANRTEATAVYHQLLQSGKSEQKVELEVAGRIGRPAIAVLGFNQVGLGLDNTQSLDHLAEGLTQDLITRLSSWRWFPVIVLSDSERFSVDNPDTNTMAAESGASYVVRGTLQCDEKHAKLNVHLWETANSASIWSEMYEFDLSNTLATQDRIARTIIARLAPELVAFESRKSPDPNSEQFEAWRHTMLGMWHLAHRNEAEVLAAQAQFELAVSEDPRFALPWFGLMWVHHHALVEQWTTDEVTSHAALDHAVDQCAKFDPNGAQTQIALGVRAIINGDRDSAIRHLQQAAYLNPSSSQALGLLGQCYCLSGKPDECIAAVEDALQLNPFNPNIWAQLSVISLAHYAAERFDEALAVANRALSVKANAITPYMVTVAASVAMKNFDQARAAYGKLTKLRPNFDIERYLRLIAPVADKVHIDNIEDAFDLASSSLKPGPIGLSKSSS